MESHRILKTQKGTNPKVISWLIEALSKLFVSYCNKFYIVIITYIIIASS